MVLAVLALVVPLLAAEASAMPLFVRVTPASPAKVWAMSSPVRIGRYPVALVSTGPPSELLRAINTVLGLTTEGSEGPSTRTPLDAGIDILTPRAPVEVLGPPSVVGPADAYARAAVDEVQEATSDASEVRRTRAAFIAAAAAALGIASS